MASARDHLLARPGVSAALETWVERLSASERATLGLVFAERTAAARSPADVLAQYRSDRFTRPASVDPRVLGAIDRAAFECLPPGYEPIVAAPLAPLGTSSVVAPVSQNKVVTTLRGTEVVSDVTNLLALECAVRRKAAPRGPPVALAASQRMVRAQALARPEHSAHFQIFVTVLAGRDTGARAFAERALLDAIGTQLALFAALRALGFRCERARVVLSADPKHLDVAERAANALRARYEGVPVTIDDARIEASRYYRGLCFTVWLGAALGEEFPIGDGGLTDWLAQLTGSRKERYFVGALGTELLALLFAPR